MPSSDPSSIINFTEEMHNGPFSKRQAFVLLTLGLLVLLDGMNTQILGVIAHDMMRDLGLPISTFGIVFSSGLLGGVVGSLVMSPVADRMLGRKTIAIGSMAVASLATLATPLATNLTTILVVRFIAGLGLGATMPSIFTLVSEYSPKRYSRPITSCLVAFMPLGSFLGGTIGELVVPDHGWRMLLYVGGALTVAFTLLAAWILPESVYFLLNIKNDPRKAIAIARRFLPLRSIDALAQVDSAGKSEMGQPILKLFSGGLWKFTLLIWAAYILNQGILYFVLSWTPALLQKSGLATTTGMAAASMAGLGGALGTASQGWLATRFNIYRVMFIEMALYLLAALTLPFMLGNAVLAPAMVFFISAGICAYHAGFILILMETYPNDIRTTGFGWALGVGRLGATSAPVLAGLLVGFGWSAERIFAVAAIPGFVSAVALVGIAVLLGKRVDKAANDTTAAAGSAQMQAS
jgi:AAHS family 4-hydroxybenzoate transporter-like MFS transporter